MRVFTMMLVAPLALAILLVSLWGAAALWFKLPGPDPLRWVVAVGYLALGLTTLVRLFGSRRLRWLGLFAVAVGATLLWWTSLVPPAEGDWAPELARQVTGEIDGDTLILHDVRVFEWRSTTDFTEAWAAREYDLSTLTTTDLFMSYWAGPVMAHMIVSFGFTDGRYLSWSIEVRRSADGSFDPVADFFKANPIIIIASEERDVVGLRTNVRGESVHMFRLRASPDTARQLLEEYVLVSNGLATSPVYFNSVFTNCSFSVLRMIRAIGIEFPLDWRLLANGYLPAYLYDHGILNEDRSLEDLYASGLITPRAQASDLMEGYSATIREGVPRAQ